MNSRLIRFHQIMLHLTFSLRSPLRTFPLIDSEWEAAQSILSSLGFSETAVTVVCIAWAPLYPSHPICIAICLSVDVIILSHKSLFVSSAVTLTWLPWTDSDSFCLLLHITCDLFKKQTNGQRDGSLSKNKLYSLFCSQTQNSSGEIKFHAKITTLQKIVNCLMGP